MFQSCRFSSHCLPSPFSIRESTPTNEPPIVFGLIKKRPFQYNLDGGQKLEVDGSIRHPEDVIGEQVTIQDIFIDDVTSRPDIEILSWGYEYESELEKCIFDESDDDDFERNICRANFEG